MVTIAVAGGTGHVGRSIVDAFKGNEKHKVIVLARKVPETQEAHAPVFAVDYNDVAAVTKILEDNNVHTVISTIGVMSPETSESEINLATAADKASSTKRFISSDWGIPIPEDPAKQLPHHKHRLAAINAARKTSLEATTFHNGYFLDYYAGPHLKSYLPLIPFAIDVANKSAAIPGTGNETVAFTYTGDVAKFVVAAIDLPKWEEATFVAGDKSTWNDFIKSAEEITGAKFTVAYDSVEDLKKGQVTELPGHAAIYPFFPKAALQGMFAGFGLYSASGQMDLPDDKLLNNVFPEIKTVKIKEALALWKGKI